MFNVSLWLRAAAVSAVAVSGVALAACGGDDAKPATTAATTAASNATTKAATTAAATTAASGATGSAGKVQIADNSFTPSVKIKAGGKVTWDWTGSAAPHSVVGTSDNATTLLKSERNSGGKGTYEVTFPTAGTYKYQCGVHGPSMSGEVIVE